MARQPQKGAGPALTSSPVNVHPTSCNDSFGICWVFYSNYQYFFPAPIALKSHSIGKGKKITSHPAVEAQLKEGTWWRVAKSKVHMEMN